MITLVVNVMAINEITHTELTEKQLQIAREFYASCQAMKKLLPEMKPEYRDAGALIEKLAELEIRIDRLERKLNAIFRNNG